jgi:hypothetical protein
VRLRQVVFHLLGTQTTQSCPLLLGTSRGEVLLAISRWVVAVDGSCLCLIRHRLPKCVHVVVTHGQPGYLTSRLVIVRIRCDSETDSVLVTPQRCFARLRTRSHDRMRSQRIMNLCPLLIRGSWSPRSGVGQRCGEFQRTARLRWSIQNLQNNLHLVDMK